MSDLDRLRATLADRYALDREIGSGGMATVYLAVDRRHNRKVAIKVLRPELSASLGAQRFQREIEVAAQLQHPNILPLLDSGEADGLLYYVMPFVDGESLRERLAKHGELPIPEAVRILVEIVDALAHAHGQGVVHRDIKPDNILMSGRHALVTDFGVAKAVSEATGRQALTTAGVALGTPSYMAPEQATADPQLDHRVDIYAIGALGYELLTGRPPFTGRSPQEILAAHVTLTPEPVNRVRTSTPDPLAGIIMRCLEKRPADRFQKADDLLAQLEPLVSSSAGVTPAQTRPSKAVAPGRGNRALWFALGGLVLAATAFATTLLPRRSAAYELGRAQPLAFEAALEIDPAISPDGRYVAYAAGPLNATRIFVRQVGGRAVSVTADSGNIQRLPVWSPDGTQLLVLQPPELRVVPALGGPARTIARPSGPGQFVQSAGWSPDGRRIAYAVQDTLWVKPVNGGTPTVLHANDSDVWGLAWSPDGQYIAFVSGDPRFSVATVQYFGNIAPTRILSVRADGASREPGVVSDHNALNVSPVWSRDGRELLFVSNRDGQRDVYSVAMRSGRGVGEPRRVTSGLNPHSISVSADGGTIAYSAYTSRSNIWAAPLRPGAVATMANARQVTTGNQLIEGVTVSADGQRLYFDSDRGGSVDVYRVPSSGGEPERLTTDPAPEYNPVESPDGRWIAFHSFKHGHRDIFVLPREGGEPVRVTSDSTQEQFPHWAPGSRALTYFRYGYGMRPTPYYSRLDADGSWSTPIQVDTSFGGADFLNDTTFLTRTENGIEMVTMSGRNLGVFLSRAERASAGLEMGIVRGGRHYFRSYDRDGVSTFWRVARAGARPELIARLDDPDRPATRSEFDTDGRTLYFTVTDRHSDVFVAELTRR